MLAEPRSTFEVLFGFGLSNKSFNGLPIDSNWLATYYDVGVVGVAINAAMLLFLLVAAGFRPQGPKSPRAGTVPGRLLHRRLVHRDRPERRVAVPAGADPGSLAAGVDATSAEGCPGFIMKILIAHNRYRSTAPSGENRVVDQESTALTASATVSSTSSGTVTTSRTGRRGRRPRCRPG